nr:putative reverse transcriptase domain-containing protein [Tanacetum cinerariifolium]
MYIAHIQEVTPDTADNSGPIFDAEPLQKVQNDNDNYNVFDDDQEYHVQPESVIEPYPDMCYDREHDDQDDTDELAQERDLLASLIEKLKCEIDDSKNRNKLLETSNKDLVDKLKDKFIIVFIDDILVFSKSKEEHEDHLRTVLQTLRQEKLYAKFSKCEFWLSSMAFLGHIVSAEGITMDPAKVEATTKWPRPMSMTE